MNAHEFRSYSDNLFPYDVGDQLKLHIYNRSERAFAAGDAARDAIRTRAQLEKRKRHIRKFFIDCLGGLPATGGELRARTVGVIEADGFKIEKVIFESRPRHFVTTNLYLPNGLTKPRAALLLLCGHAEQAKQYPVYQGICQRFARAGFVVLALDPIGQGERLSYYEPTKGAPTVRSCTGEHDYAGIQCQPLGDAIGRYFLHDAMCGVDYLQSRREVDGRRIAVTGGSGGGTQTCMLMMADPRIAAAAPCCFLMNRSTYLWEGGAQDAEQIWPGFTAAGFDHEDFLLAMAPKPACVLAAKSDFFPIEGTRRTVARCQRFWKLYGRESDLVLFEAQG